MSQPFLSSEGRISRPVYIFRVLLLTVLATLITWGAVYFFDHWKHGHYSTIATFIGIVTGIICGFAGMMQLIKRLHDMGKGPFLAILLIVPGINVLVLLYAAVAPAAEE